MTDLFPAETDVDLEWASSGEEPKFVRRFAGQIDVIWGLSGDPKREIVAPGGQVDFVWSTAGSTEEMQRQELHAGTGMALSVYALHAPDERLALVQYAKLDFEDGLSGVYAASAEIPIGFFDAAWLEQPMLWRVDVEGVERQAFITQDNRDFRVSKDGKRVELTGLTLGETLKWATVAPANFGVVGESVKRRFQKPRAAILFDLFQEAKARGALPWVSAADWDGVKGSDGVPWTDVPELEFDAGGTLFDRADEWSDLGFEWHMDSRFQFRVATSFGRDLADLVRLFPVQGIEEQQVTRSFQELRTRLFVQDGNGGVSQIQDPAAIGLFDVREQYVVFGDTVAEGDRTANGYALLNLLKTPVVERIVQIDPYAVGRRPWLDFGLGDTVGVMFGRESVPFRVLAISMSSEPGKRPRCEVVLEDMLEAARRRRSRLMNSAGGGGSVGTGQSTVFAETPWPVTIGAGTVDLCGLQLTAFISTYGKLGFLLTGTASAPLTLRCQIVSDGTVVKTFYQQVAMAGLETAEITWFWSAIPQGTASLVLRVMATGGTFELAAAGDGQMWIEAKGIQGSIMSSPEIFVNDDVVGGNSAVVDLYPGISEATLWSDLETDERPEVGDSPVIELYSVSDSVGKPLYGFDVACSAAADDGWIGGSSFTSTGSTVFAGNVGGDSRSAFFRFELPVGLDLTGMSIVSAKLLLVTDTTVGVSASVRVSLVDDDSPATISDRVDYLGRPKTTATRDWYGTSTAGAAVSPPSLVDLLQELVDSYGVLTSVVVLVEDLSSDTDGRFEFRSSSHASQPAVRLVVQYEEP